MQRYFAKRMDHDFLELNNDDIYHITKVMRMQNGDVIEVVYNEKLYLAEIFDISFQIKFKVSKQININNQINTKVTLILPLLKEQKLDYILQKGTELGVSKFVFTQMERSNIKINDKEDKKLIRWNKICREASEQSKRLLLPEIEFVKDIENLDLKNKVISFCSTTEREMTIKKLLNENKNKELVFIIGPEGGFSLKEEERFNNLGFISNTLGKNILRVETVPLYLLSIINYENMEWFYGNNYKFYK